MALGISILAVVFFLFVASIAFGGWLIVMLFKGLGRLISALFAPPQPIPRDTFGAPPLRNLPTLRLAQPPAGFPARPIVEPSAQTCTFLRCKAPNPLGARYCRRCGRHLAPAAAVIPERIAV